MKKPVYLETVEYAMLQDLAKRSQLKPDQILKNLIQETYDYLMQELDIQRRLLAEVEVSETFEVIDRDLIPDSNKHLNPNL